jgi:hypothetical protein
MPKGPFHWSQISVSKARSLPGWSTFWVHTPDKPLALHTNIRLGCKDLFGTNNLAYAKEAFPSEPNICRQGQEPSQVKHILSPYPRVDPTNISLGWNDLSGTNILAYAKHAFKASQILVVKARGRRLSPRSRVGSCWKGLPGTNVLAYSKHLKIMAVKSVTTKRPGACIIELITAVIKIFRNKLISAVINFMIQAPVADVIKPFMAVIYEFT